MPSYSIPIILEDEIDALISAGYYSSKSDVVKDALRTLLDSNKNLRIAAAVELYKENKVSIGKAAEVAGLTVPEFKQALVDRNIVRTVEVKRETMKTAEESYKRMRG